ncbi:MAG: hypothetical protein FJ144_12295 [Deltaproteobacteria bacterium]|nr:hypothetical protein [Deltaproteobacteria bacterium]
MATTALPSVRVPLDHPLRKAGPRALVVGLVALAICGLWAIFDPQQAVRSYLIGYLLWLGIALGSLAILSIHHIAGGAWGAVIRRPLEAATRTLPLLALLFVPIALGVGLLYEWAHPGVVAEDPILAEKAAYLNVPFFLVRAVIYFAIWLLIALLMNRWSIEQDVAGDPRTTRRLEMLSRATLLAYGLTVTFAAIDWVMSLEPHWFSMIFGLLVMGSQGLSAFAFAIPVLVVLMSTLQLDSAVRPQQLRDLGSFLLAFIMIWAYLALSQLLIIWSANIPEEISWYLRRSIGGWRWVATFLVVFHFALPFLVLLSRNAKQRGVILAAVGLWLIFGRWVEILWLVAPSYETNGFSLHLLDILAPIAIGGVWIWFYLIHLARHAVVPVYDPAFAEEEA